MRIEIRPSGKELEVRLEGEARYKVLGSLRRLVPPDAILRDETGFRVPARFADALTQLESSFEIHWSPALRDGIRTSTNRRESHASAVALLKLIEKEVEPSGNMRVPFGPALDPHQQTAIRQMTLPGLQGFCLFDEQGVGKTATALHAFRVLSERGDADFCLVVCPKTLLLEWAQQAVFHLGSDFTPFTPGSAAQFTATSIAPPTRIALITYDALKGNTARVQTALTVVNRRSLLIVDESYFVKNPHTERARGVRSIRHLFERAFVLCGTPAPNAPWEIVEQMSAADQGYAFAGWQGRLKLLDGNSAEVALRERGAYARRLKSEVLKGLPNRHSYKWIVSMAPEQRAMYEEAAKKLVLELRTLDDRTFTRDLTNYLSRRMILLQLCSDPRIVSPGYVETPGKVSALTSLLARLIRDEERKVIVWSSWRYVLESLGSLFKAYGPVTLHGGTSQAQRVKAVARFRGSEDCKLMIANPAVAGQGLNLVEAADAVYESLPVETAQFLQSLDRIHRRGQTKEVRYHFLVCGDTLEGPALTTLEAKRAGSGRLLGDRMRPEVTRQVMIAELSQGIDVLEP